jgi:putative FmdB family regulatory protein
MPTYEYACRSCGEHLEVVQSFRDEPLTECPTCGGTLRKVFSPVGISFKGSGFYRNDSRSSSKTSTSKDTASKAEAGDTTAKSETKSDSKSDTKSDTKGSTKSEVKSA